MHPRLVEFPGRSQRHRPQRQARLDRQADRAVRALVGLAGLALLAVVVVWSVARFGRAESAESLRPFAAAGATLAASSGYVVDPGDVLLIEGDAEAKGEKLVAADGTIDLGARGSLNVAGLTLDEVERTLVEHLRRDVAASELAVSLLQSNSHTCLVTYRGAGGRETRTQLALAPADTVLDALAQLSGVRRVATKYVWIERSMPGQAGCVQVLPVSWKNITTGDGSTNYAVEPGDRIFVAGDFMGDIAQDCKDWIFDLVEPNCYGSLLRCQRVTTYRRFLWSAGT